MEKIQAWMGFELMTYVIPVQCSTSWAIKPTGSLFQAPSGDEQKGGQVTEKKTRKDLGEKRFPSLNSLP